ncbi:hypothetical protein F5Y14DRAFT_83902 [Nemania sp. NC0429]|nr:hypothetical protein F5Y14DRAFT_83902 [Nemania sp. NC0429]
MAPTPPEITKLLEAHIARDLANQKLAAASGSAAEQDGPIFNYFNNDVEFHVNGHEFHLANQVKGIDAIKVAATNGALAQIPNAIDYSKPHSAEVLNVIGGVDSDWAAAVLKATATTFSGKEFNHEWVITIQFDDSGKIVYIKNYPDTLHIHSILQDG